MTKKIETTLPETLEASLLLAVPPQSMPPARQAKLKQRILSTVAAPAASGDSQFCTVRAGGGTWVPIADRVDMQVLHDDGVRQSWLIRMQADTRLPAHTHDGDEESLVLEGSCYLGDTFMQRGDYQLARSGSRHGEVFSEHGCLLFIRSAARHGASHATR